jgi:cation diffusion facilitator CzcD-associated flavoprotein CzcO
MVSGGDVGRDEAVDGASYEVLIVGGGPSGIGAAIALEQAGVTDYALFEKAASLGGTWRDNTYPGCACDVPSALYSYSFAPNPEWTRAFAAQEEIRRYLLDVAARFGVVARARLGVEVLAARWVPSQAHWAVETNRGTATARFLIAAAGPWHTPNLPELPGLHSFKGPVFHSARWDHDAALEGKRVAVVGTGASAVQFVPEIAPQVERLTVYQRTAQWVLPKPDHPVPALERWMMRRFPVSQWALRRAEYAALEVLGAGFRHPWLLRRAQRIGLLHLRASIKDPALRARLTPRYTLGCKRLLLSNAYYRALARPNVEVIASAVARVDGQRVVGADGSVREADVLIFGTGFHILDMPVAGTLFDGQGVSLATRWRGSPRAYRGTTVRGFPNLFLVLGPNLGTGHSSAFSIIEAQTAYIARAVRALSARRAASFEVRADVEAAHNARLQAALPRTVYNSGGCASYYLDDNGQNSFSWPWSTPALERSLSRFDLSDYELQEVAS